MSTTPGGKKKAKGKDIETFPAPPVDIELNANLILESAVKNEYQTICGAFDAKEHPLAAFIVNEKLFMKQNEFGKTAFDLACCAGSLEFLKTILERTERLNEKFGGDLIDIKKKNTNGYTCLHHACIWGHYDLCKLLINFNDTLGFTLLNTKTVNNESSKDLAKRSNHQKIVDFLTFTEIRQSCIEKMNYLKDLAQDPEKNQGKLAKDDKKKIEKTFVEVLDWLEKSKDEANLEVINAKNTEINELLKSYTDKINALPASAGPEKK